MTKKFKTLNAAAKWIDKNGYHDFHLQRVGNEYIVTVKEKQIVQTAVTPIRAEVRG